MITVFLDIIDRLMSMRKIHFDLRNERFDKVLEPTFDELSLVHGDYISMFEETRKLLHSDQQLSNRKYRKTIEQAKSHLVSLRIAYEPLRVKLSSLNSAVTENLNLSEAEIAYVDAVASYLATGCPRGPFCTAASGVIDQFDDFLSNLEFWRSIPDDLEQQSRLSKSGEEAIERLFYKLEGITSDQRHEWRNVCDRYSKLKALRHGIQI